MRRGFFARLAAGNIKKNGNTYFPYILTCIVTVMLYYIVKSLSLNPGLKEMTGDRTLLSLMEMGAGIIGLFALIFLFYTNSFLLKRRKKEFGVFHILGLGKGHLAKTLAWESLYVFLISMAAGLLFGWDKALYSIIFQFASTQVLHMLYKRYQQNTLFIVTDHPKEVYLQIYSLTNHGATIIQGEGSYVHMQHKILYSVVSSEELKQVLKAVKKVDPNSFVNVIRTERVEGRFYQRPNE